MLAMTLTGGAGLILIGNTVLTLPQLAGVFRLVSANFTLSNLIFRMGEVEMFCSSGKEIGAPTGNKWYDSEKELTEVVSMEFLYYGLMNPYTYSRPQITPLPDETSLAVQGERGLAVVPNVTAPAVNQPVLPWQSAAENAVALPGSSQPALPGGDTTAGVGIEGEVELYPIR